MKNKNKEILYSSPNIKVYDRKKNFSNNYKTIKSMLISNLLTEKNEENNNNQSEMSKLFISKNKIIKNSYFCQKNIGHLIPKNNNKKRYYELNGNSKYRINTQIEDISNKLYDNNHKNDLNTIVMNKPNYYRNVLNKKNINNLKKYINNKNFRNCDLNNIKTIKSEKKLNIKDNDLNIKDLQKIYYDIDLNNYQKEQLDESTKYIVKNRKNKYNYENYASNKNILNHPKLYVLDIKDRNYHKFPQIPLKTNEISIKLEFERKKNNNKILQESYFKFLYNTLKKYN